MEKTLTEQDQQALDARWQDYLERTREGTGVDPAFIAAVEKLEKRVTGDIKRSSAKHKLRCLDIGAGTGSVAFYLAQRSDWHVIASDRVELALKIMRERAAGKENLEVMRIDIIKDRIIDKISEPVDIITASNVLPFLLKEEGALANDDGSLKLYPPLQQAEMAQVLKNILTALKPGGIFIGHLFGVNHQWAGTRSVSVWTRDQVRELFYQHFSAFKLVESAAPTQTILQGVAFWHDFAISARSSAAGPDWSSRQMKKDLAALIPLPGYLWKGDASQNSAWIYFADKDARDNALLEVQKILDSLSPATAMTISPAKLEKEGGDKFAILLRNVTRQELEQYRAVAPEIAGMERQGFCVDA